LFCILGGKEILVGLHERLGDVFRGKWGDVFRGKCTYLEKKFRNIESMTKTRS